jgi:hypothetical protein
MALSSSILPLYTRLKDNAQEALPTCLFLIFGTYLSKLLSRWYNTRKTRARYSAWIQRAHDERDAASSHPILQEPVVALPKLLDATSTQHAIVSGSLDARENIKVVAHRCRTYGRGRANAIAQEFYQDAANQALELLQKSNTYTTGLLYGVPISVKEHIAVKGSYSTGGLACRLRSQNSEDALIVKVLKKQGAIPICSGNVTQLMMLPESVNRIWGRSKNPWSLDRTPGKSIITNEI